MEAHILVWPCGHLVASAWCNGDLAGYALYVRASSPSIATTSRGPSWNVGYMLQFTNYKRAAPVYLFGIVVVLVQI